MRKFFRRLPGFPRGYAYCRARRRRATVPRAVPAHSRHSSNDLTGTLTRASESRSLSCNHHRRLRTAVALHSHIGCFLDAATTKPEKS